MKSGDRGPSRVLVIAPDREPRGGAFDPSFVPDGPCVIRPGFLRPRILDLASPWIRAGLPWVLQAPRAEVESWLEAGAWAVLPPDLPEDPAVAYAVRLQALINAAREENPLTGLPGNTRIASVLGASIEAGSGAVAYVDITDFKPFNDYYGFARGDAVIRTLSGILVGESGGNFVGHVGGDDFVCSGPRIRIEESMSAAREAFRSRAPAFYAEHDRMRGGIETLDRHGRFRFFPFVDICVVILDINRGTTLEDLAMEAGIAKKALRGDLIPRTLSGMVLGVSGAVPASAPAAGAPSPGVSDGAGWMALLERGTSDHSDAKAVIEAAGVAGDRRASGLLEAILSGDLPTGLRKSAALSLGSLACPVSLRILREAVSDPSPHVRTRTVEALALSGDSESAPLVEARTGDPSTWVRRAAFRAAGALRTPRALRLLLARAGEAAGTRNAMAEREAALEGLALLADPAAFAPLSVLAEDPSFEPAGALWRAIAASGAEEAALLLCRSAPSNRAAAGAFQWLNPSAIPGPTLQLVEESACSLLRTEDVLPALRCLAGLPGPGGRRLQIEIEHLAGETDGYLFGLAVTVMEKRDLFPGASLLSVIAHAAESGAGTFETEDLTALVRLAARGGVRPGTLLPLLRSRRREVAVAAARAILQTAGARMGGYGAGRCDS